MKTKILCVALVTQFVSCKNNEPKEILLDFKPNKNLISFKIAKIMNEEYTNKRPDSLFSKNFDPKTDTIKYTENEIYISYLAGLTSCVKYSGDVVFKKDSLLLKLVPITNIACTELDIARVVYKVKNSKKIEFKIAKLINN